MNYFLQCISCRAIYDGDEIRYRCECLGLLEVQQDSMSSLKKTVNKSIIDTRWRANEFPYQSGVWRYRELVLPVENKYIVSRCEGNTPLYSSGMDEKTGLRNIGEYANIDQLYLKHEGENPTGSFKDRGMTTGISQAKKLGTLAVACASTGNTSASLASYAALAQMKCFVFLPKGKISSSKLAQAIGYGAKVIQVEGDFDDAMKTVQSVCSKQNIYLLNSINPFRIEGQKTILFEILQQLRWKSPDWVVLPGGNLGNTSAIGKGLIELYQLGWIKKLPRVAVVQATGANPFYQSFKTGFKKTYTVKAETVASAIRIGNPVSFLKAQRIIERTHGVVEEVTDQEILNAKAIIDRSSIGCEPASASSIAGLKKLRKKNIIKKTDVVVGILTGHIMKDPDTTMMYHASLSQFGNSVLEVEKGTLEKKIEALLKESS